MSEYTNTSTRPVGELDGIKIKPCMKSGFCCSKAPCAYGEKRDDGPGCKYLSEPNDVGQRDCMRYQWIIENVSNWDVYPAFGGGCCMPIGNVQRENIITKLGELGLDEFKIENNEKGKHT